MDDAEALLPLEAAALRDAAEGPGRGAATDGPADSSSVDRATYWGLRFLLDAARRIRASCRGEGLHVVTKPDGSPTTSLEVEIEERLRAWQPRFGAGLALVGEETGGALPAAGSALAIDPIDGTRAFLAGTPGFATTLALFRDQEARLGMVANPMTGEIAYATYCGPARELRLPLLGDSPTGRRLGPPAAGAPLLVTLQPARAAGPAAARLYEAWQAGEIDLLRSPSGSPAFRLVEVARGSHAYLNLWGRRPSRPYDLAAAGLIVARAGGRIVDLEGRDIDALRHRGPFLAAVDPAALTTVLGLLRGL